METPIRIQIVEDELIIAEYMKDCLHTLGYEITSICSDYDEALAALRKDRPDLAMIDITLAGNKSGIDLAREINARHQLPFIFASSHSDRATVDQAKQVRPYAYLIKPFSEEDLYAVIETALVQWGHQHPAEDPGEEPIILNDSIFVRHKNRLVKLILNDILYIEANDNYVTLYTRNGNYVLKTSLKNLNDALPEIFFRVHRSYIVNMTHVNSMDAEELALGGQKIPVGKSFYPLLVSRLRVIQG